MIKSLTIKNFRSIQELTIEPKNLCALIGANGAGKTNILKALDLLLGESWTTSAKVEREFFFDPEKPIEIMAQFDAPLTVFDNYNQRNKSIHSIELRMKIAPNFYSKTFCNGWNKFYEQDQFKKLCHFIYIPSDRQLTDELRVSQWTMLGKMMRTIYESYVDSYGNEENLKNDFTEKMLPAKNFLEADFATAQSHVTFAKFSTTFKKYCKLNSSGLANDFEPVLDIYNLNWFYKTLQIHIKENTVDLQFDSVEVGAGMQNLLVLSIFQTYAELMGGRVILGIEEPEIYLYPQAQRTLYQNFVDISSTSQIFYTTHNPNFVDAGRPDDLILLRKRKAQGTYKLEKKEYFNTGVAERDKHRIYTHFNTNRNEIFFSHKVLFVEGDSDKILFSILCKEKWGIDLDREGFLIVSCGGKQGVNYFVGVANLIGLDDHYAVWDEDNDDDYNPSKDFLQKTLEANKGIQIPGNLERFLELPSSDKIKNAYEWAQSIAVESIPEDFNLVKLFFKPQVDRTEIEEIVSDQNLPF